MNLNKSIGFDYAYHSLQVRKEMAEEEKKREEERGSLGPRKKARLDIKISEAEALAIVARQKWKDLVQQMETYIADNLSTTSSKSQEKINSQAIVSGKSIENLLKKRHIGEVPYLRGADWEAFSTQIVGQIDPNATKEKKDIHAVLQSIITACLGSVSSELRCKFEQSLDEDSIVKRPDATLFAKDENSEAITAAVLPHEFKLFDHLLSAACQGMGYTVSRLRGQLEMVDPSSAPVCGFSVGSNGESLIVGFADVKDMQLNIRFTDGAGILLWPAAGKPRPNEETEGIHILRRLYSASLKKLGHVLDTFEVDSRYKYLDLLGKGSFCSVIAVHDKNVNTPAAEPSCVLKRPIATIGGRHTRPEPDQDDHMLREAEVLRVFTTASCSNLPLLYDLAHTVTSDSPYLTILPIGVPLSEAVHGLRKPQRLQFASRLYNDCKSALTEALRLGFCHSDIGPDNIIFANNKFYLVDWGLARRPAENMHEYKGRLRFMHDDLILYFVRKEDESSDDESVASGSTAVTIVVDPVPFKPEYDTQSLTYVQYAVERGKPGLAVPWPFAGGQKVVSERQAWLAAGPDAKQLY